jgi:hypothetical protein
VYRGDNLILPTLQYIGDQSLEHWRRKGKKMTTGIDSRAPEDHNIKTF